MLMPRYLAGLVDLPYVMPSGQVVTRPGYNAESRLYLEAPLDWEPRVPDQPTREQVRAALVVALGPWLAYRFTDADGAAGMVSAVFTAVSRMVLELSPCFLFDAAQFGSGKTKAATALGALIEGVRPAVTPYAGSSNDDELRKRMVAGAADGVRFQLIDNVSGHLDSSVLASVLTTGRLTDRLLGQSRTVTADVRALLTLSGNNSSLSGELQRRTVQIRLNGGTNPTHRVFDFCPVAAALAQRRLIAEAVCVILKAYFNACAPDIVRGDAGGYADWNRSCRQPVLWLTSEDLTDGLPWVLGDPAGSMLADPSATDPESEALADLLRALSALADGADFTAADAVVWVAEGMHHSDSAMGLLRSAVLECAGKAELNARSMGRVFMNRRDRVVQGLKLMARTTSGPRKSWRVVAVE